MNKQIKIKLRNIYGNTVIDPVCENAKIFARIAGTKTITHDSIRLIKQLGFSILVEKEPQLQFLLESIY